MRSRSLLASAAVLLAPGLALAHPGHGHTDPSSWAHMLFEPIHAIPIAFALSVGVVVGGVFLRRRRERRP